MRTAEDDVLCCVHETSLQAETLISLIGERATALDDVATGAVTHVDM